MTTATDQESALTVVETEPGEVVEANPRVVVGSFKNYIEIQSAIDGMMPDAIMAISGKQFRKKSYWRAIATAFNLELELREERREVFENGDWGYLVTYRATARNGRTCDGDGACFVSEKSGGMATVHNVRAHAHTRAKNRAIADLVGFGEVSAEEVNHNGSPAPQKEAPAEATPAPATKGVKLSKARVKSLGIYRAAFGASEAVHGKADEEKTKFASLNWALGKMGFDRVDEVPDDRGDELVERISEYAERSSDEAPF